MDSPRGQRHGDDASYASPEWVAAQLNQERAKSVVVTRTNRTEKEYQDKTEGIVVYTITVKVTDAGDPVAGAKVAAKGQNAKTNAKGVAQLTLGASIRGKVTVTVTHATYRKLTKKVAV